MITSRIILEELDSLMYSFGPSSDRWRIIKEDPNIHPHQEFSVELRNSENIYVFQKSFASYYDALDYISKMS